MQAPETKNKTKTSRCGIVLAAGLASRMNHRPKALLERDGVALIRRNAVALLSLELDQVVVVVGHEAQRMKTVLQGLPIETVINPNAQEGQASSLQCGLQALTSPNTDVMVALADMPLIEPSDLPPIWLAFDQRPSGCHFVQPFDGERVGNPVVLAAQLVNQWRMSKEPVLGQRWQKQNPQAVHRWLTESPHYFVDLDTPEDLALVQSQYGVHLEWPQ